MTISALEIHIDLMLKTLSLLPLRRQSQTITSPVDTAM